MLGPLGPDEDPFVRANLWLLDTALAFGADRLRCICLWDGGGSDGPGGTRHLVEAVRAVGGTRAAHRHADALVERFGRLTHPPAGALPRVDVRQR